MEELSTKIDNIMFEKISEYEMKDIDTRFIKAKIWIMHDGRNYNNSSFTQEVIENAIPSLANTPILAYIEKNKDGELDVSDHREVLEKDDKGEYKLSYKGQAIGVIPETNNAHFEDRLCDDGIVRNYLVVDGLIWTKWDTVNDIFTKQNVKWQSMELDPNSIKYHFKDGVCIMDEFKFNGACCLSVVDKIYPAMQNSTIEVNFSAEESSSIAKEIENKLNQFNRYFSKKEEGNLENNKEENLELNNSAVEEPVVDNSVEEPTPIEEPTIEMDNKDESFEKEDEEKEPEIEEACGNKKKKYSINFALSHEDIREGLYEKLWNMEAIENTCYGIVKTQDSYFVYCDFCNNKFFKQSYSKSDSGIEFVGERVEVFELFVDEETKNQIETVSYAKLQEDLNNANSIIETYAKENKELKEFKFSIDEANRKSSIDEIISKFSTIDKLDLENYRQKAYKGEFNSNEELENVLFALVGKMNFSKITGVETPVEKEVHTNYSLPMEKKDSCPYAGLEDLFN